MSSGDRMIGDGNRGIGVNQGSDGIKNQPTPRKILSNVARIQHHDHSLRSANDGFEMMDSFRGSRSRRTTKECSHFRPDRPMQFPTRPPIEALPLIRRMFLKNDRDRMGTGHLTWFGVTKFFQTLIGLKQVGDILGGMIAINLLKN